uniref:Uncharacterized protein n=1 Tax=Eutreptiella gymnastica TaxID=73025 RepID=A0A6T1YU09_9EUGL
MSPLPPFLRFSASRLTHSQDLFVVGKFFAIKQNVDNRRRLPSNCQRLHSNRRWLPFKCRPTVCLRIELATGASDFFYILLKLTSGECFIRSSHKKQYTVVPLVINSAASLRITDTQLCTPLFPVHAR